MSEYRLTTFWCVDVRRFDDGGIKVNVYPVKAHFLPEHEDVENNLCTQTRDYYITYPEAIYVQNILETVNSCMAESKVKDC